MCFPAGEFIIGRADLLLGLIEGCPFYIDVRIYQSWDQPRLVLDIAQGDPRGLLARTRRRAALRDQGQRVHAAEALSYPPTRRSMA